MTADAVDLHQRWVFPGFHDCHMHGYMSGYKTNPKKYLKNPRSIAALKSVLTDLLAESPGTGWYVGYGWDDEVMGKTPNRFDLDAVVNDRPVMLSRTCCHIAVVNSRALELSGISAADDDDFEKFPPGHEHAGELTGILKEFEQQQRVNDVIPEDTVQMVKDDILSTLRACLQHGITSVHVQDGGCWNAYEQLARDDLLPINVHLAPSCLDMDTDNFPARPVKKMGRRLKCDTVKVFIDGALRSRTAALSVPYINTDVEGNTGMLQCSEEKLEQQIGEINRRGFRLEIHTIGDRAADVALTCLERCAVPPSMRPIFVHCQIVREDQVARLLERGVVSSVQPSFAPHDFNFVRSHLPDELRPLAYAWKSLMRRGFPLGGSSDSPVEDVDPLRGVHDAVFRETEEGEVFAVEERLGFDEAMELYTSKSAFVDGVEGSKGRLERGYDADFVVLDTPLGDGGVPSDLADFPRLILESKVNEVYIDGCLAFRQ